MLAKNTLFKQSLNASRNLCGFLHWIRTGAPWVGKPRTLTRSRLESTGETKYKCFLTHSNFVWRQKRIWWLWFWYALLLQMWSTSAQHQLWDHQRKTQKSPYQRQQQEEGGRSVWGAPWLLKLALLNCPAAQARLMQNRGMEARAVRATLNNAGRVSSEDFVLSSSQRAGDADKWAAESGSRGALCRGRKLILDLLPCRQASPSNNVSVFKGELFSTLRCSIPHFTRRSNHPNPITSIHLRCYICLWRVISNHEKLPTG